MPIVTHYYDYTTGECGIKADVPEDVFVQNASGGSSDTITDTGKLREPEFSSLLECPVCFSIPEGDVFNCEQGHSICGDCKKRLSKCAFCARPYTSSRNFVMESIIAYMKTNGVSSKKGLVNCVFKADGCTKLVHSSNLNEHSFTCDFRPAQCNVESSTKCSPQPNLKISDYFQHLRKHHKINGLSEASGVFTKLDRVFGDININVNWPPFYLQYDGKVFLRYATIRNRNVSWWIQLIGSEKDAEKYQAEVSLVCPNKKTLKIAWTIPVLSIHRKKYEIEQSKGVACISTKRIQSFCLFNEPFGDRIATYMWSFRMILSRVE